MFNIRRIKHITILVKDKRATTDRFRSVFDFGDARPGAMEQIGLINDHFPVGDSFVEVLEVTDPTRPAGRYLAQHGEGLYMLIFEVEDQPAAIERLEAMGARISLKGGIGPDYRNAHLHPSTNLGPLLGLGESLGTNPWVPGGESWQVHQRHTVVRMFREVAIVTGDLDRMIGRYHRYFGIRPARFDRLPDGGFTAWLPIGDTVLQLIQPNVEAQSAAAAHLADHGAGLFEVRVEVVDLDAALQRAKAAGVPSGPVIHGDGYRAALLDKDAMFGARWVLAKTARDWPPHGIPLPGGFA